MKNSLPLNQKNIPDKRQRYATVATALIAGTVLFTPMLGFASVESSLAAVQQKLVGTILPLAAICGLVIAGFSFVMGHANARQHLVYAIIGAIIGFGSESIVSLIRGLIH